MALVDVKFPVAEGLSDEDFKKHSEDVLSVLDKEKGLNYVPRERTIEGRVFEHASDTKILVHHLVNLCKDDSAETPSISSSFKVGLNDDSEGFTINREYLDLTVKANGKADLYFHAYVWTQYFTFLEKSGVTFDNADYRPRLNGLAKTLSKVI